MAYDINGTGPMVNSTTEAKKTLERSLGVLFEKINRCRDLLGLPVNAQTEKVPTPIGKLHLYIGGIDEMIREMNEINDHLENL